MGLKPAERAIFGPMTQWTVVFLFGCAFLAWLVAGWGLPAIGYALIAIGAGQTILAAWFDTAPHFVARWQTNYMNQNFASQGLRFEPRAIAGGLLYRVVQLDPKAAT